MGHLKTYLLTILFTLSLGALAGDYIVPKLAELKVPTAEFSLAHSPATYQIDFGRSPTALSPLKQMELVPGPEDEYKEQEQAVYYSLYELPGQTRSEMEILSYRASRTPASVFDEVHDLEPWEY